MPKVELISNIWHYYYTARALNRGGYLGHYITGPSALDTEAHFAAKGGSFARLWSERRLAGLPPEKIKRIWMAEVAQKLVKKFSNSERSNWVHNEIFARRAAQLMEDCDVVHFVHSVGREAARKAKKNGAKVVCDMREEHPQFQEDILSEEARMLGIDFTVPGASYKHRVLEEIALADKIFAPSPYAKNTFVQQGVDAQKIAVCPYGVDVSMFQPTPRLERRGRKFTVLFLGNVCMRKGIHYLLEGFAQAQLPDARLVLAGPVDESFRPLLAKYEDKFEAPGRVARTQLTQYYQQADLFVIPSLADAYPLVGLEAMASGLPIVVSEHTGTAGIIENGRNGYVIPIRNPGAIADKIRYLYEHPEAGAVLGAAAAETVRKLDWDNYERICADLYREWLKY